MTRDAADAFAAARARHADLAAGADRAAQAVADAKQAREHVLARAAVGEGVTQAALGKADDALASATRAAELATAIAAAGKAALDRAELVAARARAEALVSAEADAIRAHIAAADELAAAVEAAQRAATKCRHAAEAVAAATESSALFNHDMAELPRTNEVAAALATCELPRVDHAHRGLAETLRSLRVELRRPVPFAPQGEVVQNPGAIARSLYGVMAPLPVAAE